MFYNADGRLTETGQISRCPAGCSRGGSGDREGPASDGRQFQGRFHGQRVTVAKSAPAERAKSEDVSLTVRRGSKAAARDVGRSSGT